MEIIKIKNKDDYYAYASRYEFDFYVLRGSNIDSLFKVSRKRALDLFNMGYDVYVISGADNEDFKFSFIERY